MLGLHLASCVKDLWKAVAVLVLVSSLKRMVAYVEEGRLKASCNATLLPLSTSSPA
jgi:hypothetical protein